MIFRPFYYYDLGCASYLLGCGTLGKCAVVDPRADDVDAHVAFARAKNMMRDGDDIELGNTRLRVLHTPGHSPESVSLLVTDFKRGPDRRAAGRRGRRCLWLVIAMQIVAAVTFLSGMLVAARMAETRPLAISAQLRA